MLRNRATDCDPIQLRNAPAHFLQTDWIRLAHLKGTESNAIEALSCPDPGMIVYYRHLVIEEGCGGPEAQAEENIFVLVEKMIASFCELGALGQIIGHGIFSSTGLRQAIPAELWSDLKFDFAANKATSNGFSYIHVTIEKAATPDNQGDVVARMVASLTQHRSEKAKAPKKMLAKEARVEFGNNYTERAFNEAYKRVYQHPRGRPRGSEK